MATPGIKSVTVIGAGHVGAPHAITLAKKCPNVKVTVVDDDDARARVVELILSQQRRQDVASENIPTPSSQEYVLRSTSDRQHAPCQLTARLGNGQQTNQRGLLVALSRCDRS